MPLGACSSSRDLSAVNRGCLGLGWAKSGVCHTHLPELPGRAELLWVYELSVFMTRPSLASLPACPHFLTPCYCFLGSPTNIRLAFQSLPLILLPGKPIMQTLQCMSPILHFYWALPSIQKTPSDVSPPCLSPIVQGSGPGSTLPVLFSPSPRDTATILRTVCLAEAQVSHEDVYMCTDFSCHPQRKS